MSKKTFDGLTPEQQEIVKTAGKNSTDLQRKLWGEREAASMKIIMDGGVEVNEIADKSAFQEAMVPVYEKYLAANPEMTDLVNLFRNAD